MVLTLIEKLAALLVIHPGRTIRNGFHKDLGLSYLGGCSFSYPGQLSQPFALLIRKSYDVLFVHGTLCLMTPHGLRRHNHLLASENKADEALNLCYNRPD